MVGGIEVTELGVQYHHDAARRPLQASVTALVGSCVELVVVGKGQHRIGLLQSFPNFREAWAV